MKKLAVMVAFCLLSVALCAQTVLRLEDAIALYEDDEATYLGNRVIEIIKELVAKDINAYVRHYQHYFTPLMYASRYGYTEIAKSLIAEDADLEMQDNDDKTALLWAVEKGETEIVKALIEAGADIEAIAYGITALMWSIQEGHTEIIKLLIAEGADVNAQSHYDGSTALMFAASSGHIDIVKLLIDSGANVRAAAEYGSTALDAAWDHPEIANILTEAIVQASHTVIKGTGHNYYEVPYVGETSVLTEITSDEKNKLIEKYNFPITVNNFLDDDSSITGKLVALYREDIPNENGKIALIVYRLMYTLSGSVSKGMTELSFIEDEGIERQSYGQIMYILNSDKTKAKIFYRDIYFGNQDLSVSDTPSGASGNNVYFKVIDDTVISVLYTLQSSTNQNHEAILYRNNIEDIHDKTELCQVEVPFPLIDKNNPYRYTIQNAFDGNPATSFVENTNDDLMTIQFDFVKDHTFTDIALINGYAQNENLYVFNNRCKQISFPEINTDYAYSYNLDGNTLAHQVITFEDSITQSSANFDVTEIYEGTKYTDTSLAELDIKTNEGWLFGLE